MDKEPLGLMLYGYAEGNARSIGRKLSAQLGKEIIMMSASGREEDKVGKILEDHVEGEFLEREMCFAMLLGFSEQQIRDTLKGFPSEGGIKRPIFTTLTPTNAEWQISQLKEDLLEEEAYFKKIRDQAAMEKEQA